MEGGIINRENFIQSKPKKSAELTSLRDEVKDLESKLHKAATKRAERNQNLQDDTQQIISARRNFNLQQIDNQRHAQQQLLNLGGSSTGRRQSTLPEMDPSSYYKDNLSKKQRRQKDVMIAQQLENRSGIFNSANNLNLVIMPGDDNNNNNNNDGASSSPSTAERNFFLGKTNSSNTNNNQRQPQQMISPLPMIADSVFRDGMISVLIGEGWSKDQALASLIATQNIGTIAAAKNWLKTKLKTGRSQGASTCSLVSTRRNQNDGNNNNSKSSSSPNRNGNYNGDDEQMMPPVRHVPTLMLAGSPHSQHATWRNPNLQGTSSQSNSPLKQQKQTSEQQSRMMMSNNSSRSGMVNTNNTTMTSREQREDILPMSAFAEPPLLPPRNGKTSTLLLNSNNSKTMQNSTTSENETSSSFLPPINNDQRRMSMSSPLSVASPTSSHSQTGIRIRMKRPTDGKTIEIRKRFHQNDLLSTVVMTFLSEQGEDATASVSKEESEKAANFARLVSSTASKWAIVSTVPPKKAYDWTAMDRTTIEDAGVGTLGGSFQMVKLEYVKPSWKNNN